MIVDGDADMPARSVNAADDGRERPLVAEDALDRERADGDDELGREDRDLAPDEGLSQRSISSADEGLRSPPPFALPGKQRATAAM